LTLVQQVLQEHAGEVRVTSEQARGSSFLVSIPD
jgi:sensor histidine kinase regulating citrate/malate metabolism